MKRVLSLALSGTLLLAVLAAPVLTRAADKPGIAVLEFQGRADTQRWNKAGAESAEDTFVAELNKTRKFRVVSRQELEAQMREKNLSLSGDAGTKTLMQAGRLLLGVRYLLAGAVTEYGPTDRPDHRYAVAALKVRLVDVTTGEIVWADEARKGADAKVDRDDPRMFDNDSWMFDNLMKPCIEQLVASLKAADL
jgi:curli biogenesis system outer membrane secretion channel CsgG